MACLKAANERTAKASTAWVSALKRIEELEKRSPGPDETVEAPPLLKRD